MGAFFHSHADRVAGFKIKSVFGHVMLLALTAIMYTLAFPRPGWSLLAHFCLVPMTLLAAWAYHWKRLTWTSMLIMWPMWLYLIYWLWPVTGGGNIALAGLMACYTPAYLLTWRVIHKRFHLPAIITVPMVFVTFELVRGCFLSGGFGWFGLGHTQAPWQVEHGVSRLIQIADLFGEWTVSFVVAMSSGAIVDLVLLYTSGKRGGLDASARQSANAKIQRVVLIACLWIATYAGTFWYGQMRIDTQYLDTEIVAGETVEVGKSYPIAVVQTNVLQTNKMSRDPKQLQADFEVLLQLTRGIAQVEPRPKVIVLPETVTPWPINDQPVKYKYGQKDSPDFNSVTVHNALAKVAKETGCYLFVGSISLEQAESGQMLKWNSVLVYQPNGVQLTERYSKMHRVPFGEYVPWVEDWPWLKDMFFKLFSPYGPGNDYTLQPGDFETVFNLDVAPVPHANNAHRKQHAQIDASANGAESKGTASLRVVVPICFEDAVARVSRRMCYDDSGKRTDIMFNLTNDGWFHDPSSGEPSDEGVQHVQMAAFRCIENRVPVARSVNTGVSGFIDSVGRVGPVVVNDGKSQLVAGARATLLRTDPRQTLYGAWGQWPVGLMALLTGALGVIAVITRRKGRN